MPIDSINNNDLFKNNNLSNNINSSKITSNEEAKTKNTFLSQLSQVVKKEWDNSLDKLLSEIDKQGKNLSKKRTFFSLKKYREVIGQFLKEFSSNNQQTKEFKSYNKKKSHTIIKTINKEVEELTKKVVDSQVDNLIILDKIDEIRGLLVDLRG